MTSRKEFNDTIHELIFELKEMRKELAVNTQALGENTIKNEKPKIEEDKIVGQTLQYEKKRQDYTNFWEKFIDPLQKIAQGLKSKNEVHQETNGIIKKGLDEIIEILKKK